jgi:3-dehydroquinate synthase
MKKVKVELGENSYEIRVGSGMLERIGLWLREKGFSGKAVIVTDSNAGPLYAGALERSLANAGFKVTMVEVPAGEEQKTLETAASLYDKLAAAYTERTSPVLALGGGVVGDLAGFVAATYQRGVPLIQIPTTLLAMVDSSIGGKTAVDQGQLKNIVGVFYQPKMVVADIDTLKTLPKEELSNGMAEVIKLAAIRDKGFFEFLEKNMEQAMAFQAGILEEIVLKNAAHKAEIVAKDEKESGQRIILNYGHTIGHAIEAVSNFKIKHGQAVAMGMIAENKIAVRIGLLREEEDDRIAEVIKLAGLPAQIPNLSKEDQEKVLEAVKHDKKVLNGRVRFILLKSIGSAVISDKVEPELIGEVLFGWGKT